jgi:hypothetical protein
MCQDIEDCLRNSVHCSADIVNPKLKHFPLKSLSPLVWRDFKGKCFMDFVMIGKLKYLIMSAMLWHIKV